MSKGSTNETRRDLMDFIGERFRELAAEDLGVVAMRPVREPFADWEAEWFFRGIEQGLFEVAVRRASNGFAASWYVGPLFVDDRGRPMNDHFFETAGRKGSGVRKVGREGVTHAAAMASLVGEFGWPAEHLRAQSERNEVDIVAYDRKASEPTRKARLGSEVKLTGPEMQRLVTGMSACRAAGTIDTHRDAAVVEGLGDPRATAVNHHKKCGWIARARPRVFWAVSRDADAVFDVDVDEQGSFILHPAALERLTFPV